MSGTDDSWRRLCIVGIGAHARTKLIPAIEANGQAIAGLVSRKAAADLPDLPLFGSVEAALAALPGDTGFVLASPPAVHAEQALAVVRAGADVVIEKPAFITVAEADAVLSEAVRHGTIVVEAFMHRLGQTYAELVGHAATAGMCAIDVAFRVPVLPEGTFRQQRSAAWTCLYDIGCYAVSLFTDLGLPLDALAVETHDARGRLQLAGTLAGVRVTADVGVGDEYVNSVALTDARGGVSTYAPFFYGRAGERTIVRDGAASVIEEDDAFRALFAVPRAAWHADQTARHARMRATTACLERLARRLPNTDQRG